MKEVAFKGSKHMCLLALTNLFFLFPIGSDMICIHTIINRLYFYLEAKVSSLVTFILFVRVDPSFLSCCNDPSFTLKERNFKSIWFSSWFFIIAQTMLILMRCRNICQYSGIE